MDLMPQISPKAVVKRKQMGQRVRRELRLALKAAAAIDGISMDDKLDNILCTSLGRPDLMIREPEPATTS